MKTFWGWKNIKLTSPCSSSLAGNAKRLLCDELWCIIVVTEEMDKVGTLKRLLKALHRDVFSTERLAVQIICQTLGGSINLAPLVVAKLLTTIIFRSRFPFLDC